MPDINKQIRRSRNAARNKAERAGQILTAAFENLNAEDHWISDRAVDSIALIREQLNELNKWTHEMSAYSNAYNIICEVSP